MPELPEIEHLRRTLEPRVIGGQVIGVELKRADVWRNRGRRWRGSAEERLLKGQRIERLERHGKNLAIIGSRGPALGVHLGMSGQMLFLRDGRDTPAAGHVHCMWKIDGPKGRGLLVFRDPRRFGGLWTFDSFEELVRERWSGLGPDALTIKMGELAGRLRATTRAIKAALLDQSVIAGVGNIYADEALFFAAVHPETISNRLNREQVKRLAGSIREVLRSAVKAGGSTLRDYVDANGEAGWFHVKHAVYGRAGRPCLQCGGVLERTLIAQRTTMFCPGCQARNEGHRAPAGSPKPEKASTVVIHNRRGRIGHAR